MAESTASTAVGPSDRQDAGVAAWAPVIVVVVLLVGSNVVSNRLLPDWSYVPWNMVMAGTLLLVAMRLDRRSGEELGLGRAALPKGLRLGAVIVGLTALVYLASVAIPWTRALFDDSRVEGLVVADALYAAFVRVPLGTVLLEEVAFRGVLPAMLIARVGTWRGVGLACGLFGMWHVLPSLNLDDRNPVVQAHLGSAGVPVLVTLAVLATAAAGVWLWALRRWSGSLAAPALAHWSTNGLGYLLAYFVAN